MHLHWVNQYVNNRRIGLHRLHPDDHIDRILLSVHNDGAIIPALEQAQLFEPFRRGGDAMASGKRGWGLGLTVVRGIIEAHKGEVTVESFPKEGTTFTVDLPVDPRS